MTIGMQRAAAHSTVSSMAPSLSLLTSRSFSRDVVLCFSATGVPSADVRMEGEREAMVIASEVCTIKGVAELTTKSVRA